jgi:hypothetical protein
VCNFVSCKRKGTGRGNSSTGRQRQYLDIKGKVTEAEENCKRRVVSIVSLKNIVRTIKSRSIRLVEHVEKRNGCGVFRKIRKISPRIRGLHGNR